MCLRKTHKRFETVEVEVDQRSPCVDLLPMVFMSLPLGHLSALSPPVPG